MLFLSEPSNVPSLASMRCNGRSPCEPCEHCFDQHGEIYDPQQSCSFVELEDTAPLCQAYHGGTTPANPCPYTVWYGDVSHSTGILATESFTFETSIIDATTTNPLSTHKITINSSASTNPLSRPCKTNTNPHYNSSATTNPRSSRSFAENNPSSSANKSSDSTRTSTSSDSTPSSKDDTPSASTTSTSPSVTVIRTSDAIQTVITGIGFGCGRTNIGNFDASTAGIAELGGGPLSLSSQLGAGKFSYCLTIGDKAGKLVFGDNPMIDGPNTKRTQIIRDPNNPTFHYLNIEGISVGDKRLDIQAFGNEGFIIDSGTTLNTLQDEAYEKLTDEMKAVIPWEAANDPSPDPVSMLEICYKRPNIFEGIPDITYHFSGGADWIIPLHNFFVGRGGDVIYFALHVTEAAPIMGNMAQEDMVVEFDVNNNVLSFASADCTTL
ncbi:hypothetical protein AMTR_s00095p00148510 [Amborella trichopoda]|uniref:Peptidase A1 domain-containing protein n=1 Tax=Amborella trichopoda TaxID=13333 RepID=W1NP63_AMBTC|nr:hypothetical protein AMTR_s00095p00148510 [Amborella trichopoda]